MFTLKPGEVDEMRRQSSVEEDEPDHSVQGDKHGEKSNRQATDSGKMVMF